MKRAHWNIKEFFLYYFVHYGVGFLWKCEAHFHFWQAGNPIFRPFDWPICLPPGLETSFQIRREANLSDRWLQRTQTLQALLVIWQGLQKCPRQGLNPGQSVCLTDTLPPNRGIMAIQRDSKQLLLTLILKIDMSKDLPRRGIEPQLTRWQAELIPITPSGIVQNIKMSYILWTNSEL